MACSCRDFGLLEALSRSNEDAEAAIHSDFTGVQAMGEGVSVLMAGPLGAVVCHFMDATIASHLHTVDVRNYHIQMKMVQGIDAEVEVDF